MHKSSPTYQPLKTILTLKNILLFFLIFVAVWICIHKNEMKYFSTTRTLIFWKSIILCINFTNNLNPNLNMFAYCFCSIHGRSICSIAVLNSPGSIKWLCFWQSIFTNLMIFQIKPISRHIYDIKIIQVFMNITPSSSKRFIGFLMFFNFQLSDLV